MSKRFENGYFALIVVCGLCLVSIGYIAISFAFSQGYQSADQEHSTYYANREAAEIAYRECLGAATNLDGARQCIDNAETTSRESERAEQDLNAQREMAQWAKGMLWAAWIVGVSTFGATVVGVRYIYLTLIATQDMARDTTRIGEAQVRAYMVASAIDARPISDKDGNIVSIGFKVSLDNTGQSPANIHKLNLGIGLAFPGQKIRDETDKHDGIAFMTIGAGGSVKTVEMKMDLTTLAEAAAKKGHVVALVYCEYTDIFYDPIENNVTHSARIAAAIELDEDILNPKTKKTFRVNFTYLNPDPQ